MKINSSLPPPAPLEPQGFRPKNVQSHSPAQSGDSSLPIQHQWNQNNGYCMETALKAVGMEYGQYVSPYTARALITKDQTQQSLINDDSSDVTSAKDVDLKAKSPPASAQANGQAFLNWAASITNPPSGPGHPVIACVMENCSSSYFNIGDFPPDGVDAQYDHIIVIDDISNGNVTLRDWGLYTPDTHTHPKCQEQDTFTVPIDQFLNDRDIVPNSKPAIPTPDSPADNPNNTCPYSLANTGQCFGLALMGCEKPTKYPVSVSSDQTGESDTIVGGNNGQGNPPSSPYTYADTTNLTATVSDLDVGKTYTVYEFTAPPGMPLPTLPDHDTTKSYDDYYNSYKGNVWDAPPNPPPGFYGIIKQTFTATGSSQQLSPLRINSHDTAIFRCVPAGH